MSRFHLSPAPPGAQSEFGYRLTVGLHCSGNCIIIAGTTLALITLTWGGITYPWVSTLVLVPLVIGGLFIVLFFLY